MEGDNMNITINGIDYECRAVIIDVDKTTVYYGTFADDGIEDKTDIVGNVTIEGQVSYTANWYKKQLADTDYIAIKIAEGAATVEEYADIIAQRQAWRDGINAIESENS